MIKIVKFLLFILFSIGTAFGQIRNVKKNRKVEIEERNERKQEVREERKEEKNNLKFIKDIFRKEYKINNYPKFIGTIIVKDSNIIKFNEKILIIPDDIKEEYKLIFTEGIFYPNLVYGNRTAEIKTEDEINLMTQNEKLWYNMQRADFLRIGHFEELISLNPNYKTKRFLIWIFSPHIMNPTEWYFEIKNPNAKKNMKTSDFIKGSLLTFYKQGGLII